MLFAAFLVAAFGASAQAGPGHAGHDHSVPVETPFGRPGEPGKARHVVEIAMNESDAGMRFAPNRLELRRGEQVQFVLRNQGELEHELVIGTAATNLKHAEEMNADPEMAHEDPNAKRLRPKEAGVLHWQFTESGTFEYACLIPGHRDAGMVGTIVVK
jgi:uncharacterized cupredoxin-like copper-binding protein